MMSFKPESTIRERRHWFERGKRIWDVNETFTEYLTSYPYGEIANLNGFGKW